ncbi:hypothetical protein LPJ66_011965, partial [Kickxella alabastrina]
MAAAVPPVPVVCWVQPEFKSQVAVGSDAGVHIFRMCSGSEAQAGTYFQASEFRSTRQAVTALTAHPSAKASILATGSRTGEVELQFLGEEHASRAVLYAETGRATRALAFNPAHTDTLACGFEQRDGLSSLRIYDVRQGGEVRQLLGGSRPASLWSQDGGAVDVAGAEPGDAAAGVTSVAWVPGSADALLVASRQSRGVVRLFDLRGGVRDTPNLVLQTTEGAAPLVYDVHFDPFNSLRYLAADGRGHAGIWDLRWQLRPLHVFSTGAPAAAAGGGGGDGGEGRQQRIA